MFEAFMNLLLVVMAAAMTGLWIAALADYDGKCDEEDCGDCLFPCGRFGPEGRANEYRK